MPWLGDYQNNETSDRNDVAASRANSTAGVSTTPAMPPSSYSMSLLVLPSVNSF